jgi:hypothetical protein
MSETPVTPETVGIGSLWAAMGMAAGSRMTWEQALRAYGDKIPATDEYHRLYDRLVIEMAEWREQGYVGGSFDDG